MDSIERDYSTTGLTIRTAMLDHVGRYLDRQKRPEFIRWGRHQIKTSDAVRVPMKGVFKLELLSWEPGVRQGVDVKVDGWIKLGENEKVPVLRTWREEEFEDEVEYEYMSRDGIIRVWNVYEMKYQNGQRIVEHWTENAGFWLEVASDGERVYHCSHGMASPPSFEAFNFKLTITAS